MWRFRWKFIDGFSSVPVNCKFLFENEFLPLGPPRRSSFLSFWNLLFLVSSEFINLWCQYNIAIARGDISQTQHGDILKHSFRFLLSLIWQSNWGKFKYLRERSQENLINFPHRHTHTNIRLSNTPRSRVIHCDAKPVLCFSLSLFLSPDRAENKNIKYLFRCKIKAIIYEGHISQAKAIFFIYDGERISFLPLLSPDSAYTSLWRYMRLLSAMSSKIWKNERRGKAIFHVVIPHR